MRQRCAAAYALNDPLIVRRGEGRGAGSVATSLVACDAPNVIVETVKQAEDGNGIIVRLYETQRRRGTITLTTGFPLQAAARTNLLEEEKARAGRGRQPRAIRHPPVRDRDAASGAGIAARQT